jgi:hypothetical protein
MGVEVPALEAKKLIVSLNGEVYNPDRRHGSSRVFEFLRNQSTAQIELSAIRQVAISGRALSP